MVSVVIKFYFDIKRFLSQILSRQKPASFALGNTKDSKPVEKQSKIPVLEEFLDNRDYTGAMTLLEVLKFGLCLLESDFII